MQALGVDFVVKDTVILGDQGPSICKYGYLDSLPLVIALKESHTGFLSISLKVPSFHACCRAGLCDVDFSIRCFFHLVAVAASYYSVLVNLFCDKFILMEESSLHARDPLRE